MSWGEGLTGRQKKFVVEYVLSLNATQAVIAAGYKANYNSARTIGFENLTKPNIKAAIAKYQEQLGHCIPVERLAIEYLDLLTADPADFFDDSGDLLLVKDMPRANRMALENMEISYTSIPGDDDKTVVTKKIKFTRKIDALKDLVRMAGGFTDNTRHSADDSMKDLLDIIAQSGTSRPQDNIKDD